jgi:hypothetical protein
VKLPSGDLCDVEKNYTTTLELQCSSHAVGLTFINPEEFNPASCHNHLILSSTSFCNSDVYIPWYMIIDPRMISAILFLTGLFFIALGYKFEDITIPLMIILTTAIIIHLLAPTIPIIACICFGVVVALFTQLIEKVIYIIIIFLLSNICATLILQFLLHYATETNPATIYLASLAVCAFVLIIVMKLVTNLLKVLVISIIGSYFSIRVCYFFKN